MSNNFENGLQRLYYVSWLALALWAIGYAAYFISVDDFESALILIPLGVILPGVVMFAVRWIYRGFKPKDSATRAM